MLGDRDHARVREPGREGHRHPGHLRRRAAEGAAGLLEERSGPGDVGNRRQVDVHPHAREEAPRGPPRGPRRGRPRAPDLARPPARRAVEAADQAPLLVDHHQQRHVNLRRPGHRLQARGQRPRDGRARHVRAEQHHRPRLTAADAPLERRRGRGARRSRTPSSAPPAGPGSASPPRAPAGPARPRGRPRRAARAARRGGLRSAVVPLVEVERGGVDAEALAGRGRSVGEDVARGARRSCCRRPPCAPCRGWSSVRPSTPSAVAGAVKLGQPVPDSNLVSESNSGSPQQTQV